MEKAHHARQRGAAPRQSGQDLARFRPRIESAIERLLAVLDAMDGDPDLEGYTVYSPRTVNICPDLEDDRADEEPSLGSLTSCTITWETPDRNALGNPTSQENWAGGSLDEREEENEHGDDTGQPFSSQKGQDVNCLTRRHTQMAAQRVGSLA